MKPLGPLEYPKNWESTCLWDGKISVHFGYPAHGWVRLSLLATAFGGSVVIDLSEVFDPFWEMVGWLKTIADDNLPASFKVDEEGNYKEFIVSRYAGHYAQCSDIEFRVSGDFWNEQNGEVEQRCYFLTRATRKQLLGEFTRRLESWLANDYEPDCWLGADPNDLSRDLRNLDLAGLKLKIQNIEPADEASPSAIKV